MDVAETMSSQIKASMLLSGKIAGQSVYLLDDTDIEIVILVHGHNIRNKYCSHIGALVPGWHLYPFFKHYLLFFQIYRARFGYDIWFLIYTQLHVYS